MERKNYELKAFTNKGKEIKLQYPNVFYDITEEIANGIRIGIAIGLFEKYKDPQIIFREV